MADDWMLLDSGNDFGGLHEVSNSGDMPLLQSAWLHPPSGSSSASMPNDSSVVQPMAGKILVEPSEGGVPRAASSTYSVARRRPRSRLLKLPKKAGQTDPRDRAPRTQKLRRRVSDTRLEQAKAGNMVCVWGGDVKKPVIVHPVWEEAGATWMSPNEHCLWLRRACSETHYKE
jgi:hypothetical protein